MPGYKGHLATGIILYTLIMIGVWHFKQPSLLCAAEWLFFLLCGSLFPDVDVKSKGQHLVYLMLFLVFSFLLLSGCYKIVAVLAVLSFIPMLVPHRGLFHNIWFIIAASLLVGLTGCACAPNLSYMIMTDTVFFITGALSHLALDRGVRGMWR